METVFATSSTCSGCAQESLIWRVGAGITNWKLTLVCSWSPWICISSAFSEASCPAVVIQLLNQTLWHHRLQHAGLLCPPLSPGVCSDSLPLSQLSNHLLFSSVTQPCPTLCDPMNRSTPGLPVYHQLPESTQTHVHRVSGAIQPSHPLSSPSPPTFNLSQHQGLFKWVSSSHQVAKVLEFQLQHQSFQWTSRTDGLVGSPCSPRDSQESSPTPQFKSINSSVLSFLYNPPLTSVHGHWKNHSLD